MEEVRTRGEIYEGIAFQFCKIATVALICGRFALPVAAGLSAIFYALAIAKGKADTRCWVRYSALLVVIWTVVCLSSLFVILFPATIQDILRHLSWSK